MAYPLALPDAIVVLLALMLAHRRRPHLSRPSGVIGWIGASVAALAVLITVVGALAKLSQGLGQFFSAHGNLWGGDVLHFLPVGAFLGTGGGVLPALVVCAAAVLCLRGLPRATAIALAAGVLLLGLVDIRFRLAASGAYMDFKQLSFVGPVVLTMAVVGAFRLLQTRRGVLAALGLVLVATWGAAALIQDHREVEGTDEQVTPDLLQIREWARRLPSGASVRVDIPPSGLQLWGVYMLAAHPVDAPHPVDNSTYAYAPHGLRADFSLSLRYFPSSDPAVKVPFPRGRYTVGAPLFANSTFVLRRVRWPARLRSVRSTASRTLVEP